MDMTMPLRPEGRKKPGRHQRYEMRLAGKNKSAVIAMQRKGSPVWFPGVSVAGRLSTMRVAFRWRAGEYGQSALPGECPQDQQGSTWM